MWCVFVFDTDILDALKADGVEQDRRVDFLLASVAELDEALETADRILVMSENTIVGEHRNADVDMDRLLAEVAGQRLEVTGS